MWWRRVVQCEREKSTLCIRRLVNVTQWAGSNTIQVGRAHVFLYYMYPGTCAHLLSTCTTHYYIHIYECVEPSQGYTGTLHVKYVKNYILYFIILNFKKIICYIYRVWAISYMYIIPVYNLLTVIGNSITRTSITFTTGNFTIG